MPPLLKLPRRDGLLAPYTLTGRAPITAPPGPIKSRIGMAAVHVVADPLATINPTLEVAVDWDATLRYRHHIWSLGLAVAGAMDTSQRGRDHPDGQRGAGGLREGPGRLLQGVRPYPRPGARAGDHPLARRYVRPLARGLLGLARSRPGHRDPADDRPGARGENRRCEDLAPRSGARSRDAQAIPGERPDVHRRRLRLSDHDSRRRRSPFRRAARHLRRDRARRVRGAQGSRRWRPRTVRGHPRADAHALASDLPRAHALLQDRRGLRRLPEWPPVALPDGGRA